MRLRRVGLRRAIRIFVLVALVASGVPSDGVASGARPQTRRLEYCVWATFGPDTKGFTVAVVGVDSIHFNREDMASLAEALNNEFSHASKLKAGLYELDVGRGIAKGKFEPADMRALEKGRYVFDRDGGTERIEFLAEGKKGARQSIDLGRMRRKKRS